MTILRLGEGRSSLDHAGDGEARGGGDGGGARGLWTARAAVLGT
jgi:hypothetical protein